MPTLSVVIPTWNNADLTDKCLRSLSANTAADLHIVWIDNGSSPEQNAEVREAIAGFDHDAEYHPEPLGFARAVNRGLVRVRGDYCVILNNDVEVMPGWDSELRAAVDDQPGLAGPICVNSPGWQDSRSHDWLEIPASMTEAREISGWLYRRWAGRTIDISEKTEGSGLRDMLAFFCVLMPAAVSTRIGLLDENYGWGYYEDNDYCFRAKREGFVITLCPGATVLHKVSQTLRFLDDDHQERLLKNFRYFRAKFGAP